MFHDSKKAQDLPISFIVIAGISILVLILVAIFFFGSFRTEAADAMAASNKCSSLCLVDQQRWAGKPYAGFLGPSSSFCSITTDVKGLGDDLKCDKITSCSISFTDGTRMISCTGQ